jgi:hypothetical protein
MPIWTCPKCGGKVEAFGWNEKPWNTHVCQEIRKPIKSPYADMGKKVVTLEDFV